MEGGVEKPKYGRWRNQNKWLNPVLFDVDEEREVILEWDLERDEMARDWSFTAWGEDGPVEVGIDNKISQSFPYVKKDDSKLPEDEGRTGDGENDGDDDNGEDGDEIEQCNKDPDQCALDAAKLAE
jgi:hypothetical protein